MQIISYFGEIVNSILKIVKKKVLLLVISAQKPVFPHKTAPAYGRLCFTAYPKTGNFGKTLCQLFINPVLTVNICNLLELP